MDWRLIFNVLRDKAELIGFLIVGKQVFLSHFLLGFKFFKLLLGVASCVIWGISKWFWISFASSVGHVWSPVGSYRATLGATGAFGWRSCLRGNDLGALRGSEIPLTTTHGLTRVDWGYRLLRPGWLCLNVVVRPRLLGKVSCISWMAGRSLLFCRSGESIGGNLGC